MEPAERALEVPSRIASAHVNHPMANGSESCATGSKPAVFDVVLIAAELRSSRAALVSFRAASCADGPWLANNELMLAVAFSRTSSV